MADEYIRREDAIEEIDKWLDAVGTALIGKGLSYYGELIGCIEDAPAADVAPVVHGKWVHTDKHLWYKNKDGSVDEWRIEAGYHNGPVCEVCGECFCVHCEPDYADTKCKVGHYVCSECGEVSRDRHEKCCPGCGALMDGGNEGER